MGFNKKFFTTGGIVAASPSAAPFDPLQNFETVTYTGNGGTQNITGYIRKGAAFNGSSSKIVTSDIGAKTGDISISAWVYFNSVSGEQPIVCRDLTTTTRRLQFRLSGGKVNSYWFHSGGLSALESNSTLTTGQWYHIVSVWEEGVSNKIYINGSLDATDTTSLGTRSELEYITIGYLEQSNVYLNGKIDQVRIFNTALPATGTASVASLYAETYASSTKSTTDIFGDGSGVALYELDENANDTGKGAIDSGQSGVFNGSSSGISIPSVNLGTSFTISVWFNWDGQDNNQNATIVGSNDENPSIIHNKFSTSNSISYDYSGGSVMLLSSVTANQWYHIVIVHNGTSFEGFVNGVSGGTNTVSNITATIEGIGYDSNQSRFLSGKIDQVRFYSSALSGSDITKLFNESSVPTANLVAWYKLDGDATDETTNYDGTWTGTEAYTDPATFPVYNGTATDVNFLGMAFSPDFVWIKQRSSSARDHNLTDTVRGADRNLASNTSNQDFQSGQGFSSFDSNGFTLDNSGSDGGGNTNINGVTHVAWCWKAGGTPTATNSNSAGAAPTSGSIMIDNVASTSNLAGSIAAQKISANTAAGFSIGIYTGNSSAGATIAHGLTAAPELLIVKSRNTIGGSSKAWTVYAAPLGNTKYFYLNVDTQALTYNFWNNTDPTTSVFSVSSDSNVNATGGEYVFYAFHSVVGYQSVGTYTGNGNSTGTIVTTGFTPRWVMIKSTDQAGSWIIVDSVRSGNPNDKRIDANDNAQEQTDTIMDLNADGFQLKTASAAKNGLNKVFIYLAIA